VSTRTEPRRWQRSGKLQQEEGRVRLPRDVDRGRNRERGPSGAVASSQRRAAGRRAPARFLRWFNRELGEAGLRP
jgi:hypothetical protein